MLSPQYLDLLHHITGVLCSACPHPLDFQDGDLLRRLNAIEKQIKETTSINK